MAGLGTVEAAKRVHGVGATTGTPAMVMVVGTDNVDKACADLAATGVPVLQPPHDTGSRPAGGWPPVRPGPAG